MLEHNLGGAESIRAVLEDHRGDGFSTREVAILDYALAAATGGVAPAHIGRL